MRARPSIVLLVFIGIALALGAIARSASSHAPSFAEAKSYATAEGPEAITAGDLNGDRKPDLVTVSHSEEFVEEGCPIHVVSVLLNRGDGTFGARRDFPTSGCPLDVAIGDMNGDGKPDLVSANWSDWEDPDAGPSTVSLLLNEGEGTFEPERAYPTGPGAVSVAVADVNDDGALDVATGSGASFGCASIATASVLLNRGDGTLGPKHKYRTGRCPTVALGDLDGDGRPELVTGNEVSNTVSVLHNRGDGTFASRRDYRVEEPASLSIGDLDHDGRQDVASATENAGPSAIDVLFNRGRKGFRHRSYVAGNSSTAVVIDDMSGDGKPDLAYVNEFDAVSVRVNVGGGSFLPRSSYASLGRAWGPTSLATSDLNGDGRRDLAVANLFSSKVTVFLNTPGLCNVQRVGGKTLAVARRRLAQLNCRVGKVRHAYSKQMPAGRVISQKPAFGAVRPGGAKVDFVLSRGRRK